MTDLHDTRDLEDLYGPMYKYSDHKRGEHITYRSSDTSTKTGTILWVVGPGPTHEGGQPIPAHYIVQRDGSNPGWPDTVFPSDIIEEDEPPSWETDNSY